MRIIDYLFNKQKRENRRLDKLESDIVKLTNRFKYNPKINNLLNDYNNSEAFSNRITENFIWFSGNTISLRKFYLTQQNWLEEMNMFWAKAPAKYRKVHSGIPKLLCTKMPIILFGSNYDIKVEVYKKDSDGNVTDKIDAKASKHAKDTLLTLLKKMNIQQAVSNQAVNESRDGHTVAKLSYDKSLSQFPIYEVVDIRNFEIQKERGITKAIVFKTWLASGSNDEQYCHHEIYTTDDNGHALVINKLYKIQVDGEKEVELTTLPETSELPPEISFPEIDGLLAFEKPNKLPNSEFIDCVYGASDYAGAISAFDGLDETLSEIFAEIRNNKTIRYFPASMLPKEIYKDQDGKPVVLTNDPDAFITNYQKVQDTYGEETAHKVDVVQIPDKMASLLEKWKIGITTVCNLAGISPLALGITGLESINSGADSQRERNKATIETRNAKLELWKPYLEELFIKVLEFNRWYKTTFRIDQDGVDDTDLDWSNCSISVVFPDYIVETSQENITTWGSAKQMGIASTEVVIDKIHKEWSEESKKEEVNRIKFEQGTSVSSGITLSELDLYNKKDEENKENSKNSEDKD